MWSKISNAFKSRPHDDDDSIYEQHPYPYLTPVDVPAPATAVSKRSLKLSSGNSKKLGISLPKKVKSSLSLNIYPSSTLSARLRLSMYTHSDSRRRPECAVLLKRCIQNVQPGGLRVSRARKGEGE
jgi:hypothetical protein